MIKQNNSNLLKFDVIQIGAQMQPGILQYAVFIGSVVKNIKM